MAIRGSNTSKPLVESNVLKDVEAKLQEMQHKIQLAEKPKSTRALGTSIMGSNFDFNETGMPMNEDQLIDSNDFLAEMGKKGNKDQLIKELLSRVSELEDKIPEFKGLNSWDVQIQPLLSTATLPEVIKTLNVVIQRNQRQDRIK